MAEFLLCHEETERHEGYPGWVDDPDDPGGETVAGLTFKNNPTFPGWAIVKKVKAQLGKGASARAINALLRQEPEFKEMVRAWFKKYYWDPLNLDGMANQRLAASIYDFVVNAGDKPRKATFEAALEAGRKALQAAGLDDIP